MIGKKDTCAYCHEKIDLKDVLKKSAWRSQSLLWMQLLDGMCVCVCHVRVFGMQFGTSADDWDIAV